MALIISKSLPFFQAWIAPICSPKPKAAKRSRLVLVSIRQFSKIFAYKQFSASNALHALTTSTGTDRCCSKAPTNAEICWIIKPSRAPILDRLNNCSISRRLWECSKASLLQLVFGKVNIVFLKKALTWSKRELGGHLAQIDHTLGDLWWKEFGLHELFCRCPRTRRIARWGRSVLMDLRSISMIQKTQSRNQGNLGP